MRTQRLGLCTLAQPHRGVRCLVAAALMLLHGAAVAQTWPANHGGPQRQSWTPAKGSITAPALRWRMPLGGSAPTALLIDADFDDATDVVAIAGGRVRATRLDGTTLWLTPPLAVSSIYGEADLDGDGATELVTGGNDRLVLLSLATGQVLGTTPPALVHDIGFVRVTDVDGDGDDELLLASSGGSPSGYVMPTWTLDREGLSLEIVAQTSHPHPGVEPHNTLGQDLVDTDGDGLPELLLPTPDRLHLYDLQTGVPIATSASFERIGCRWVRTVPVQQGSPRVLCWGDRVLGQVERLRGLRVFEREGEALVERWSVLVEDDTKHRFWMPQSAVLDVDADGDLDAVYAIWDGTSWRTTARDIESGAVLFDADSAPALVGHRIERALPAGEGLLQATLVFAATESEVPAARRAWLQAQCMKPAGQIGPALAVTTQPLGAALSVSTLPGWSVEGAPPAATPQPALWLARDADADDVLDGHEVLRVHDGQTLAAWPGSDGDVLMGPATLPQLASDGSATTALGVLTFEATGAMTARGGSGEVVNDGDGDGVGDLASTTGGGAAARVVTAANGDPRVVLSGAAGVAVLDPAGANLATPPQTLWQSERDPFGPDVNLGDLDGDGVAELVLRGRRPYVWLESRELDGSLRWRFERPEGVWRWTTKPEESPLLTDLNGDGSADVVVRLSPVDGTAKDSAQPRWIALDGETGASLWAADAPCAGLGDGSMARAPEGLFLTNYHRRFVCAPASGALVAQAELFTGTYGVPAVWPGAGPGGATLITLGGGSNAVSAQTLDPIGDLWSTKAKTMRGPTATGLVSGAVALFVSDEDLSLVRALDASTGAALWSASFVQGQRFAAESTEPFGLVGMAAVGDLSGDDAPDLLFGHEDGRVYLVDAALGDVHWAHDLGGATGAPVPADVDGDGALEVLVTAPDGRLHALDKPGLLAPAWVRENAGEGLALSDAEDVDAQDDAGTIHANWAPVLGADRYLVAVRTADGGLVDGPRDVGSATAAALGGLVLQLGVTYEIEVVASQGETGDTSPPRRSDGLIIVDEETPTIEGFSAAPDVISAIGDETLLSATLRDNTRLHSWRVTLRRPASEGVAPEPARTLSAQLASTKHELAASWDLREESGARVAPGAWVARLEVQDQAGLTATASRTVYVCGQPAVETSPACAGGLQPGGLDGAGGGVLPTVGTTERRRGAAACALSPVTGRDGHATGGSRAAALLLVAALVALVGARRRSGATRG